MSLTEQFRARWQALTGQRRPSASGGGGWQRPETLCPECGSEDIQQDFNKETSTQLAFCPDCGYRDRQEVLPANALPPRTRLRA